MIRGCGFYMATRSLPPRRKWDDFAYPPHWFGRWCVDFL